MKGSEHIEEIAAYLEGDMSQEEMAAFEARMASDPALSQEVRTLQALEQDSYDFHRVKALSEQIAHENTHAKTRPLWQKPVFRATIAVAAGIALLIFLRPLLFEKAKPDHEALFAQYFEVYDDTGLIAERGENTPDSLWREAGEAYREGEYSNASALFSDITKIDSSSSTAYFYLANSLLAEGKTQEAIASLQYIIKQNDFFYSRQAHWLLALAYLKNDQVDLAVSHLQKLTTESDKLNIRATSLLKQLEL